VPNLRVNPLDARLDRIWQGRIEQWQVENGRDRESSYIGTPPPEDFLPVAPTKPYGFEIFPKSGSAWLPNLIVSLAALASMLTWQAFGQGDHLGLFVATHTSVFKDGEIWRLMTALLGHGDLLHLLHNGPILWFFAWILYGYFGLTVALWGSLAVGVLSNWTTLWFYEEHILLLGASGMVYGMVAMWLVLYIRFDRHGRWEKRVMRSLGFSLLILFPQTYQANVSYLAHASGFFWGVIAGLSFIPWVKKYAPIFRDPYYHNSLT